MGHAMPVLSLSETETEPVSGVEQRLLDALKMKGAQTIEQLASLQPTVSWAQVFLAIDRLSRVGLVFLRRDGGCRYCVSLNRTGAGAI